MIIKDLNYVENVNYSSILGGIRNDKLGINVAFIALVEQSSEARASVFAKSGDANAEAIAVNQATVTFGDFPGFS